MARGEKQIRNCSRAADRVCISVSADAVKNALIFTASGSYRTPLLVTTHADILVIGGGSDRSMAGSLVVYRNYMLPPNTLYAITVGTSGMPSAIAESQASSAIFVAEAGKNDASASGNVVNQAAETLGPVVSRNYAVSDGRSPSGLTSITFADGRTMDLCSSFGGICDTDTPLIQAAASAHVPVNGTGSAGLVGVGASGLVVIVPKSTSPNENYQACFSYCIGTPHLTTFETSNLMELLEDTLLDIMMYSIGSKTSFLFVRDAFFRKGVYTLSIGTPQNGGNTSIEGFYGVSSAGTLFINQSSTNTLPNDYVFGLSSTLSPGSTVLLDNFVNVSLCRYFPGFAPNCILGGTDEFGRIAIRRSRSINTTCRSILFPPPFCFQ